MDAFKSTYNLTIDARSLVVRFRRNKGSVGLSEKGKKMKKVNLQFISINFGIQFTCTHSHVIANFFEYFCCCSFCYTFIRMKALKMPMVIKKIQRKFLVHHYSMMKSILKQMLKIRLTSFVNKAVS